MRAEAHVSVVRATVRSATLPRHAAVRLEQGRAWAVSGGIGFPRLWGYATDAALEGFGSGLVRTKGAPGPERLAAGVDDARARLTVRVDALVERHVPDATLLGLLIDGAELHAISVGAARVYVYRGTDPKRLTPKEDPRDGLMHATPSACRWELAPGDLVLAGSVSAFSMRAIARLATIVESDRAAQPSVLASILTEPAAIAGIGAAALVLRFA